MLALIVAGFWSSTPAGACSEPGPDFEMVDLEDLEEREVVAIGQPEVVARTGATWRWHRAGVLAFTEVWLVTEDLAGVTAAVWTMNDGRDEGGDCYFGRDVPPIGSRQEFHALYEDGSVASLTGLEGGSFDAIDHADLTSRYGEPVAVSPDPGRVDAALAPLTAERRFSYLLPRFAVPLGFGAASLFFILRRSRRPGQPSASPS